jgi:hypothetical protein
MNARLERTFGEIEKQRGQMLSGLQGLPAQRLSWSPPGKWSILRILSHLITGERTGLEYVRKKILGVQSVENTGPLESFKMSILVLSQRFRFLKYKAPKLIEDRTVVYSDLDSVEREWDTLREDWRSFLENIPEEHVNKKIFRHVVAGRLNVEQGLRFFAEHVAHHKPQIEALLKADLPTVR